MLDKRNFYINGKWVPPVKSNDLEVINPSSETPFAVISLGDQIDTDNAVNAANNAFSDWSTVPKNERIALVERILAQYEARADDMAEAISTEMGAPIDLAKVQQVPTGVMHTKNFIKTCKNFQFERKLGDHAPNDRIIYEPIGVCGLITPWNWPMNQVTLKVIPALLTGCTMVLKPSEIAPLSSYLFAEFLHDVGLPAGVFNLVNGDGPGVGRQLSGHKDIDMISFTGSTRAGIDISKNAANTLKRVHLELGGKGANIIFPDAPKNTVRRSVLHCFNNSGQSCNAPTRMLVHRDIYNDVVRTASDVAKTAYVRSADQASDGSDGGTLDPKGGKHIGPVVSKIQFEKIQNLIQQGIDEGARLIVGGTGRPEGLNNGYYVKPTVFADVSNDMSIAQQEIFGPVLSIIPFDTEEEAIDIANDTVYGLTNYVQSEDGALRNRICKRLRSGMVEMNGKMRGDGSPFGGTRSSGNGREGGAWGLEDFMEVKSISGWAAE